MDMSDHRLQWGCPYCPQIFPSRDDVKEHLGQQHIIDLLSHVQQALSPSCQQLRETTEGSTASDGGNDVDLDSMKRPHAEEPLRCPHSDCKTNSKAYTRKDGLLRHFKTHVVYDVTCECGDTFDIVDRFEKHLKDCPVILKYKGGTTDDEKKYNTILGMKQALNMKATEVLNKQQMSNDTPSLTIPSLKRKRSSGEPDLLETKHQDFILEDCTGAIHLGSLDSLDSITSYASRTFDNSTSYLYPDESTNDPPLAENVVDGNSLTHESNNFGQPSQIDIGGLDWNEIYAYTWGGPEDWKNLYAIGDYATPPDIWTDDQGQATNI